MHLIADTNLDQLNTYFARYRLTLIMVQDDAKIPGSFWGEPEAGLIGDNVYVRADTPVHSFLHEACHAICMSHERRNNLHTDALSDDLEEVAVTYLQVLLGEQIGYPRERQFADMDEWGYSFRLGSAKRWFEEDAEDAVAWLERYGRLPIEDN